MAKWKRLRGGYKLPSVGRFKVSNNLAPLVPYSRNSGGSAFDSLVGGAAAAGAALATGRQVASGVKKAYGIVKSRLGGNGTTSQKSRRRRATNGPITILANGPVQEITIKLGAKRINYPRDWTKLWHRIRYVTSKMDRIDGDTYGKSVQYQDIAGSLANWKVCIDKHAVSKHNATPVYLAYIYKKYVITNRDECNVHLFLKSLTPVSQHAVDISTALTNSISVDLTSTNETTNLAYPFYDPTTNRTFQVDYWRKLDLQSIYIQPGATLVLNVKYLVDKNIEYSDLNTNLNYYSGRTYGMSITATGFPVNDSTTNASSLAKPHVNMFLETIYCCGFGLHNEGRLGYFESTMGTISTEAAIGIRVITDQSGDVAAQT